MTAAVTRLAGDVARPKPRRLPRKRLLMLLLFLGLAAAPGGVTSISRMLLDVVADPPVRLIVGGMLPGDRVSASVRVSNEGQLSLRYAVTTATSDHGSGLASVLLAEVGVARTGCGDLTAERLGGAPLAQLTIGDPQSGAQPGDRTLAPGHGETLCIWVTLPHAAGDRYQDAAASAAFSIVPESIERSPGGSTTYLPMAGYLASMLASPVGLVGLLAFLGTLLVAVWLLEELQWSMKDASQQRRAAARSRGSPHAAAA